MNRFLTYALALLLFGAAGCSDDDPPAADAAVDTSSADMAITDTASADTSTDTAQGDSATDTTQVTLGTAVEFDGQDDYMTFTNADYAPSSPGFTWEMWIRPAAPPSAADTTIGRSQTFFVTADTVACEDIYIGFGSEFSQERELTFLVDGLGGCGMRNTTPPTFYPSAGWQADTWYHIAGTVDYTADEIKLYVNGAEVANAAFTGTPLGRLVPVHAGRWADGPVGSDYFNGRIDELRVYENVLTPTMINAHYNGGLGTYGMQSDTDLLAGWHFDENTGMTTADFGAGSNTGNFFGGATWAEGVVALP